jgi:hypothetical protein
MSERQALRRGRSKPRPYEQERPPEKRGGRYESKQNTICARERFSARAHEEFNEVTAWICA